jgi:hypothetical protein
MEANDMEIIYQIRKENADFIQNFLDCTSSLEDTVGEALKATICQFLKLMRRNIAKLVQETGTQTITFSEIYEFQQENLKLCLFEVESCLKVMGLGANNPSLHSIAYDKDDLQ